MHRAKYHLLLFMALEASVITNFVHKHAMNVYTYKDLCCNAECEQDECFAKKRGFYSSNGSIDTEALIPVIEKQFENVPEAMAAIKENCVEGDLSKYGPPDMCDFAKLRHCVHVQLMSKCNSWIDTGDCAGIKELVEECAGMFQ